MNNPRLHFVRSIITTLLLLGTALLLIVPGGNPAHAQTLGQHRYDVAPLPPASLAAPSAVLVVTSRTDSGPGSLRQALSAALPGDAITFDPAVFPPATPMTITLLAELPEITQGRLTIDGSNAGVVLDGRYTLGWSDGLRIRSDDNTVKGLSIVHFPGDGIELTGAASGNRIGGNWQTGSAPHGEGNIITLNGDEGIDINGSGTDGNIIAGNLVGSDADGTRDVRIQSLAVSPAFAQDSTVFIGTRYHGALKSTDGGQHWGAPAPGLAGVNVLGLSISPNYATDRTAFAGAASGRIYRSTDGGSNWIGLQVGAASRDISAIALSPAYAIDGHVFAATAGQGFLVSTDRGSTWQFRNTGLNDYVVRRIAVSPNYATDHTLFAIAWTSMYRSTDGGLHWDKIGTPGMSELYNMALSPAFAADRTLFVSTAGCRTPGILWKSTNGGDSWVATGGNPGWCHVQTMALAPDYATRPVMVMGDNWGGIYRSTDGGTTWALVHATRFVTAAAFSPAYTDDHSLLAGLRTGDVVRSNNGGDTWMAIGEGLAEQGNTNTGVHVREGAQRNVIGGETAGARNIIGKNGAEGIVLSGSDTTLNVIAGNHIGVGFDGRAPLGNATSGIGLRGGANSNTVKRNVVSGNGESGIVVYNPETMDNTIIANLIGLDSTGAAALGNFYSGVTLGTGTHNNRVGGAGASEGNVISGNGEDGVAVRESSSYNIIIGNRIGTNAAGTAVVPNYYQGLSLTSGSHHNQVGGPTTAERNLISGNGANGIGLWEAGTRLNVIIGNYIGTDASGAAGLGNREAGIVLSDSAEQNRVGGETAAERNVIADNGGAGVNISSATVISNTIVGNAIGTTADSMQLLGNHWGVACWENAQSNVIHANVIAGSTYSGVHLDSCDRNTITGNFIGTDPTGTRDLGNRENGISVFHAASGNQLGPNNIIAFNRGRGISVWEAGSIGNRITENAIFANSAAGIDLGEGGNADLSAPVVTVAGSNFVSGFAPVAGARVEIFSDENGQGRVFEGATTSGIDGSFMFAKPSGLTGPQLNVTATDLDGNTTEFSPSTAKPPQSNADPFEPDDGCSQARSIGTAGTAQPHTFHQQADADWAWFDVIAGATYVVESRNTGARANTVIEAHAACAAPPTAGGRAFGPGYTISFIAPVSGRYYLKIFNHDPAVFGVDTGYNLSVRKVQPTAVAVIVAGHDGAFTAQENITYAADRAYRIFRNAGIPKTNIRYLAPQASHDADGDGTNDIAGLPTIANVRAAVQDWPRERGVALGVPFYLYLVDHGLVDRFKADGDARASQVSAADLNLWLSNLEVTSGADNINVIIDACYSGSFIDETADGPATISGRNRVVIASTTSSLQAFGPMQGQGLYFSNAFFSAMDNQQSLWAGFQAGVQAVAVPDLPQYPWLDDNGDHRFGATDGALAAGRALRRVEMGDLSPRIEWVRTDARIGQVRAKIDDDSASVNVWVEVLAPSYVPPQPDGSGTTRILDVPVVNLRDADGDGEYSGTFSFAEDGAYRLVAYAQDGEGNLALPVTVLTGPGTNSIRLHLPLILRSQ